MLARIGAAEADLRCGMHVPIQYGEDNFPPRGTLFDQRPNNCSGKHAGFLGFCCMHGYGQEGYLNTDHPLQQEITREVASLAGLTQSDLWFGTDGCSAPTSACRCGVWR